MHKILVVAITPPPYGGQALMAEAIIKAKFKEFSTYHVRMSFSDTMATVGKVKFKKLIHMVEVVLNSINSKLKYNINILYYIPGGSNSAPVIRDIFILSLLRIFFSKVIFHFHVAGVSEVIERLPFFLKSLAKFAYRNSDLNIYTSGLNPDYKYFISKHKVVVPNGVKDEANNLLPVSNTERKKINILFVGVVQESKGVMVLAEASKILIDQGFEIVVYIVGEFSSNSFEKRIRDYCQVNSLVEHINFVGVKKGKEKWKCFSEADLFCFPSFFESESFGLVNIEAMMFKVPIVSTMWRGIPDVVDHGKEGFLVPINDPVSTAEALKILICNPDLRKSMGENGRNKFLEKFQFNQFIKKLEDAFLLIAS